MFLILWECGNLMSEDRLIGKVQSDIEWLKNGQNTMMIKIDHMIEVFNKGDGKINVLKEKISEVEEEIINFSDDVKKNSEFRTNSKAQLGFFSVIAGAVGFVISKFFEWWK